ncbi:MAG: UDP-2,4-diacetamido-2,4,6-trideoxy-beta-L-altropyranose hydrolase [Lachnospiraceae bacterium]|nr:UDP-2,4-diacetamido-2,4,6-trideoxy-beta-L-altropyranose hydrolase [Lachnospiraceae bacterium]
MLIIRADGNARIGAGHLMRCLTIAHAVHARYADKEKTNGETQVLFLCADEDSARMARDHGFQAGVLDTDYRQMESELSRDSAGICPWDKWITGTGHVILVDSYYVTERYLQALHAYGSVFLMDDLQAQPYPVDGVINYNVFADPDLYRRLYRGQSTKFFLGAQYAPLREQFQNTEYSIRPAVQQVLLTTGGGDADNIAEQILRAVYAPDIFFHVLVGRFSPHFSGWTERAEQTPNLQIHYDVKNMAELMCACDLAITAGGSTVYELAAVGIPFLCFSYAENQEALAESIGRTGSGGFAGAWHKDRDACTEKIAMLFKQLCKSKELREEYSVCERRLTDGQGAGRLADILVKSRIGL